MEISKQIVDNRNDESTIQIVCLNFRLSVCRLLFIDEKRNRLDEIGTDARRYYQN